MTIQLLIPKGEKYLGSAILKGEDKPYFKDGDGLPYGVINKKYTGIGATTLQLKSKSDTILVLPFVNLAEEKASINEYKSHFCKSGYNFKEDLQKYLESDIQPKRLIVVADNLHKLKDIVGNDIYKEFHVVIDEIDILQVQSEFRPVLPLCIDEFLKFDKKTLLTATFLKINNPKLQVLPLIEIEKSSYEKKEVTIVQAKDPIHYASKRIIDGIKARNERFLIGCNSISHIRKLIDYLKAEGFTGTKVLAADTSLKRLKIEYSGSLIDKKLPSQVTICTSAYFSGVSKCPQSSCTP